MALSKINSDSVDLDGNVGIGGDPVATASNYNGAALHLRQANSSSAGSQIHLTTGASGHAAGDGSFIAQWSDNDLYLTNQESAGEIKFSTGGSQRVAIDSSGNVGIGTASPATALDVAGEANFSGTTSSFPSPSQPRIYRSGSSSGSYPFDSFGNLVIQSRGDGSNKDIVFATGTAGANRITIDSSGNLFTSNKSSNAYDTNGTQLLASGEVNISRNGTPMSINRNGSDGGLINFYRSGSFEGSISISGTTVSYNGGHLARWSQTADNTRITGLLKGTVLTNLDQMAEWTTDGVTENNEQLNCMAVSSVEGDPNVAGVFVNWDDDDDVHTNDMNVAMTGDMIIRIAQGTTVARGDLLMSAGDGTAKPQGDDIVRSKTIAKVTSTNVSCTYDDNSYCVPCVLMAC